MCTWIKCVVGIHCWTDQMLGAKTRIRMSNFLDDTAENIQQTAMILHAAE